MNNKIIFSFLLLIFVKQFSYSQQMPAISPNELAYHTLKAKGYLAAIDTLLKTDSLYIKSPYKSVYFQMVSTYYSFVGNRSKADEFYDRMFDINIKDKVVKKLDSVDIPVNVSPFSAKDFIIQKAKEGEKVIMINEAHYKSHHRILTNSVLKELYEQGFRYLALEALADDSLLVQRKYPLVMKSGFYTNEPMYGNMIREALKLGYTLIGYDYDGVCDFNSASPNYCKNVREIGQAKNLQQIILQDKNAKILVHAGYGHIRETPEGDWLKMADIFKILTGINPLTIDQTSLSEKSNLLFENPYTDYFIQKFQFKEPIILLNQDKTVWTSPKRKGYDAQVVFPRDINGALQVLLPSYQKFMIPKKHLKKGNFIQFFATSETAEAVPINQIVVEDTQKDVMVFLPKGEFNVKVTESAKISTTYSFTAKIE